MTLTGSHTKKVPLLAVGKEGLLRLSSERLLSLSLDEMTAIQKYFRSIRRDPTDVELETIAQTWSEHCKHKTFSGTVYYQCETKDSNCPTKIYKNLFKETIVKATRELNKTFCLSVFEDNAGIISFDKGWAIAFKVETHNHPSALEPYGGAGTGLGGVIRDILGAGLGAKPILNTDIFCVGEFGRRSGKENFNGTLTPERVLSGITAGVRDYGNRMGIPTGNGAIFFHEGYRSNPLVFCGTVGLIPKNKIQKKVTPGEWIVCVGGRTGRDGIHGATFSSLALEKEIPTSVVQIGHALVEKKVADALLRARDKNLYTAVTDCGAGGFSSAIGELGSHTGAKVYLEKAPLKYEGLPPWEIWLSESQERMVLSLPEQKFKEFQAICETEDVECSVIGEFSNDRRLTVFYQNEKVCDLGMNFLHQGIPRLRQRAVWKGKGLEAAGRNSEAKSQKLEIKEKDYSRTLKKLLAHPNIGSKKWVIRQYDHEVQGGSIVKPLVGKSYNGPGDAAVYRPQLDSWRGIAVSNGINPLYGEMDPYWMAAHAIDESLRNLVAVGGTIEHCALLDNFCWGNVNDPEILGGLVRCAQGCYDFSKGFGVPFISGKDSLNNTWKTNENVIDSIPGTILISAVCVVEDVRRCVTMDFKKDGNFILLLGEPKRGWGGSHFNQVMGLSGGEVPEVDALQARKMMLLLSNAIRKGWVRSCHDLSEGGLAVALAEMCIAGECGAKLHLPPAELDEQTQLFSESPSRWILEVEPKNVKKIIKIFSPHPISVIGKVDKNPILAVRSKKELLKLKVGELNKFWNSFSERQCR